jgi:mannose-6-phosphate isomerase-like protein (cupin superfamily)
MHAQFDQLFTQPENSVFKVVFYPDRIYHAPYLNATRSERYRYNVREVRSQVDITVLKGEVYMDGQFLTNFLRIEYHASRLVEQVRERNRFIRMRLLGWLKLLPDATDSGPEATVAFHYDRWINAYQVELWGTLEPPPTSSHDYRIIDQMGYLGPITRIAGFDAVMSDYHQIKRIALAFRENDVEIPDGYHIGMPEWDNNFLRSHEEPRTQDPSSPQNTIGDKNYLLDFQRDWYVPAASDIAPVRYRNPMMDPDNPDAKDTNIIEMRWLFQRELGSSVVFFHEVTVPPGAVEGTHQHIGTEELYYIVQGEGLAYVGDGDAPGTDQLPTVTRQIYGIGPKACKELPVKAGSVIFNKSGGIHGIRNPGTQPLKFVAFLYHTA